MFVAHVRPLVSLVAFCASLMVAVPSAVAQVAEGNVELGGHVNLLHLSEFDTNDVGVGVQASWPFQQGLAIDGALTWFPGEETFDLDSFSGQSRVLGLAGLRGGITRGRVELYARGRVGFLRFGDQDDTICILIFPTPLACRLATGYTALAGDLGGGASIGLDDPGRLRLRIDVGDLLVRYDIESAIRPGGEVTDGFVGHNLLAQIGLGWRF